MSRDEAPDLAWSLDSIDNHLGHIRKALERIADAAERTTEGEITEEAAENIRQVLAANARKRGLPYI